MTSCERCGKPIHKFVYKQVHRRDHPWGLTVWKSEWTHTVINPKDLGDALSQAYSCDLRKQLSSDFRDWSLLR